MKTNWQDKQGAVLLAVVISMIAAGLIGAAVLSMATSARYERVTFGITNRAYYLAESGAAHVRARKASEEYPPFNVRHAPITNTMANGDQFIVTAMRTNVYLVTTNNGVTNVSAVLHTFATSIGIANPGTPLEARQQISFDMVDSEIRYPDDDRAISIFTGSVDKPVYNDDMFDETGTSKVTVKDTGPSEGIAVTPMLDSKSHEGHLALAWQNKPSLADALLYIYEAQDGLLGYDVQMKLGYFPNVPSTHFMMGISFRFDDVTKEGYGLSFFHSQTNSDLKYLEKNAEWVLLLDANFQNLRGSNYYAVLWYRDALGSPIRLINARRLPDDFLYEYKGVLEMKYYNTLLLQLREEYVDAGRVNRENHITAYLSTTNIYPAWPTYYTENALWQESASAFPTSSVAPLVWDYTPMAPATGTNAVIIDARVTAENFATNQNAEIGIHLFYDRGADNESFFRDFAVRLESIGTPSGGTQIQW